MKCPFRTTPVSFENPPISSLSTLFCTTSAPSEARLCRWGESPHSGSPGKAPDIECCVGLGNDVNEAYTGRSWATMRKREGNEPRYQNQMWMLTLLVERKATPEEPTATASEGPPGSKTVARDYGKAGNSGDPIDSSNLGVGRHNRSTGRNPDGRWEVGCPHSSEEVE